MTVNPGSLAVKGGLMLASMALNATNRIEGPRLDNLGVSLADYGTLINRFWGIRRLEGLPIIWAEKLREEKVVTKTKGGKYENYKYYGTWAVLIADHQIDGIRRVWMDKHLVYQLKDAGPLGPVVGLTKDEDGLPQKMGAQNVRVYLGTEDQEPDPRIEAWCEDRYGVGSCPAYRGCAYMVFENIPLEKFGNRIPQITAEGVVEGIDGFPYEVRSEGAPGGLTSWSFSPDYTKFVAVLGHDFAVWDVPTRSVLTSGSFTHNVGGGKMGLRNDGTVFIAGDGGFYRLFPDASDLVFEDDGISALQDGVWSLTGGDGTEHLATRPVYENFYFDGSEISPFDTLGVHWSPGCFVTDAYGDVWAVGSKDADAAGTVYFWRLRGNNRSLGSDFFTVTGLTRPDDPYVRPVAACHSKGGFIITWGVKLALIDDEAFTLSAEINAPLTNSVAKAVECHDSGNPLLWIDGTAYDVATLTVARTVNLSDWTSSRGTTNVYDPINNALISPTNTFVTWLYLDRIGSAGVTLGTIVEDVAGWCDIAVDADDLDQVVTGYSVTQGSGKDMIGPLLDIHDSDCHPHDFTIKFSKRGKTSLGTILTSDFVREGDEDRYSVSITQDTDIPRRLTVNFADEGRDQQTNTVISQRPLDSVDGVREQAIDLTTYVTTPADAQQLSDRRFRRLWNERENITNALTMQQLALEPADVVTLSLDGTERNARLVKMTISQGRVNCEFRRDALTLASLNSSQGAEMEGREDEVVYVPGPGKGIVLETPYLSDSEANVAPLIHYAGGGYGESFNFPGVIFYKTDLDDNEFSEWNTVDSASRATWGTVTGALNACDPWVWDRGSSLSVNTFGRALTSSTEAAINADPSINLAMIGDEAVNFVTATLETDGTYTLSGFKRGRRGTEWACNSHSSGETFVLAASLETDAYGLSEIGVTETFKAQMLGRDPVFAPTTAIALSGATLKPYAPARLKWVFDGTDLQGTIVRRTRVGGAWVGGATIPLSENSEAYEVDIYNGATFKRTVTVTGTNTFTYTAAMAAADGISLPTLPTSRVYQMSDAVGRGYALAA